MKQSAPTATRRHAESPRPPGRIGVHWLLALSSAGLLTLAFAPFGQFYLAWVGLAPWIVLAGEASTIRRALLWGWLSGIAFFALNLWWLWTATIVGTIVLILYFALYWGLAAALIRALRLLPTGPRDESSAWTTQHSAARVVGAVFLIPAIWVALEWARCYVAAGFPWMPLANSQTPLLLMCQVADFGGPWVVSYWVVAINALVAGGWILHPTNRSFQLAAAAVVLLLVGTGLYGGWRYWSTVEQPGLRATVVQSNFPHLRGGAPTVSREDAAEFLLESADEAAQAGPTDLIVLPEAALPPINEEARHELARAPVGPYLEQIYQRLRDVASTHHTSLVVGANAVLDWQVDEGTRAGTRICNSAYFIPADSSAPVARYDKICLVPFSEQMPFRDGPAWLRWLALTIAADRASQPLHPGATEQPIVFSIKIQPGDADPSRQAREVRAIAPICLENVDPAVVASMVRDPDGHGKRADVVINLSNDGWFAAQQRHQHLQAMPLRSIENRVPMIRCSNTGISAFFDSRGQMIAALDAATAGFETSDVWLDDRVTFYTRCGDLFAWGCVVVVLLASIARIAKSPGRIAAKSRQQNKSA